MELQPLLQFHVVVSKFYEEILMREKKKLSQCLVSEAHVFHCSIQLSFSLNSYRYVNLRNFDKEMEKNN